MAGRRALVAILLTAASLFGQSTTDLADYLVREFRAGETDTHAIREVKFSEGDAVFRLTTAAPGQLAEQTVEFNLGEVDVYTQRMFTAIGKGDFVCTYSLVAAPRGRGASIRLNMARTPGPVTLVANTPNATRIRALEQAFARLTERVAGRSRLVPQ